MTRYYLAHNVLDDGKMLYTARPAWPEVGLAIFCLLSSGLIVFLYKCPQPTPFWLELVNIGFEVVVSMGLFAVAVNIALRFSLKWIDLKVWLFNSLALSLPWTNYCSWLSLALAGLIFLVDIYLGRWSARSLLTGGSQVVLIFLLYFIIVEKSVGRDPD